MPFGLVVRVDALQCLVKGIGKSIDVGRCFVKLNEPLVTTFTLVVHKHRCRGVLAYAGTSKVASLVQSFFSIINNEFFAKGIDKALGASTNNEFIRISWGELHCVAYLVAPQATTGADNNGIVASLFNLPQRQHSGVLCSHLIERNEFVEHTIVNHQEHSCVEWVVL